ncbi:MAG: isopeptide-forming domain-containing fimbrial protein [Gammaproteobacteria bacterium]|nr:isopeptide-forming domain-containing fimbrial protein [Gammaproteobacteria bacterium]
MPANLGLDLTFTPTATINGIDVVGFATAPMGSPNGPLIWGRGNGDNSLDIPAAVANPLILTYRVIVEAGALSNTDYTNSVQVDWTSLDNSIANSATYERYGDGCPTPATFNDYCTGPATSTITVVDTNTLVKTVTADTYATPSLLDGIVRVGDTVTYQLSLNLQEGTTRSVNVQDVLPAGLEFVEIVSINGDTIADYSPPGGSNFSYSTILPAALPTAGQTTFNFVIGDVVNTPDGNDTNDSLVIVYRARVIENTLPLSPQNPSTILTNTATLQYIDGDTPPNTITRSDTASITVYQPVMTVPTKTERTGRTSPASVLVSDTMQFRLESCNTTGLSPAYNVQITDDLDSELNQTTIANLVVTINGVAATAGVDYTYTAPLARGGFMQFDLTTAVDPAQCVRIDYDIGIYNDFPVNTTWDNTVTVNEYWSLPAKAGQQYAALGPTTFSMTNNDPFVPPAKVMLSPVSDEATVGETVVYQITLPASNGARHDVVVSDDLHSSLEFVSATEVSGNGFTLVDTTTLPGTVRLGITYIPALQNAVIQVTARVANNVNANAGVSFANTTTYDYAYISGGATVNGGVITTADTLKIVEPVLALAKTVSNTTSPGNPPNAGDVLRYSLTFTASGGVANDNFEDAFDVGIIDTLSLGLAYQTTTSTVDGAGNTITDPTVVGDGVNTGQSLTWNLADATADIDVVEGTTVTVTYDVVVLNTVLANQVLTNSAVIQWTSLDGVNVLERTGTAAPALNDYFTGPATTTLTTPDTTVLAKTRVTDTYGAGDTDVRIGDIVEYQLSVTLQEGLTNNVVLTDSLPQGLAFESVVHINTDTSSPYSAIAPFVHNDITAVTAGNPLTGASTVTFTLGNVTNTADNNAANDNFIIRYRARVLDNVFTQVNSTTLTNTATLTYDTASGGATTNSAISLTLLQPTLTVTKTALAANGVTVADPTNTILEPDELVTYTVNVTNTGTTPAYDVVVDDVIPVGMRNGTATITMVSTTLQPAGTVLTNLAPTYNSATGLATWDFDSGVADAYNIPVGQSLRIVYTVQADSNIGANLTLSNQALARLYYSFDDDDVPVIGSVTGVREIYGPSNTAVTTLTTGSPGVLLKENPAITNVTIGETFTYKITVPAIAVSTYLHDVRITDNLGDSLADLTFVSAAVIGGPYSGTLTNTGTATNLVIEDVTNGIDIPPNQRVEIGITVRLMDTNPPNIAGLNFINTARYTYNQVANDATTQQNGDPGATANMTIVEPDTLTMTKTGPASINIGTPETFTLNIQNTGTSTAWDLTVTDVLPDFSPAAGGMCATTPTNIVAQMYLADGVTTVGGVLVQGTDYVVNYSGCTLTLTMQSSDAAIIASSTLNNRLIITYDAELDSDTPHGSSLTNYAWATQWFSQDTAGAGATGETRTYTRDLSVSPNQGTVGTLDHEDAYTVTSDIPTLTVEKSVYNVTTSATGANASPGNLLRYTINITNTSAVELFGFRFTDDLDALNATARFIAGTLNLTTVPVGADITNTDVNGGTKGTGLVDIGSLSLGAAGSGNETIIIEFEVQLTASIPDATIVYNQGHMLTNGLDFPTDDPALAVIANDPTETLINSAPNFVVEKISTDLTGDPNILLSGDTLRYTITVKNTGTEDAINTYLRDQLPANTTYVAGSTTLNGNAVAEPTPGTLPLQLGILINAAENATPGAMRADATASVANVATIIFDVTINTNVVNGTIISNQAYVSAEGIASGAMADTPSDDPGTPGIPNDPTRDVVGNQPLVDALKTVSLYVDNNSDGFLDPGDIIRYTITLSNIGATPATGVRFVDAVPANTTYITDSVTLNTLPVGQPDAGTSPLIAGIPVSSSDLTPPLPTAGNGILSAGANAVITFDVQVDAAVAGGTIISNQGNVYSNELPVEPTDADGIDSNGDQPTVIVVGNGQLLTITKSVAVVGGGPVVAGGQLEYRVLVRNVSAVDATNVTITDNLDLPVAGQLTYVVGSGLLNGLPAGVDVSGLPVISADYDAPYGNLPAGQTAELVFRVDVNNTLPIGTTITNTANVYWNAATQTDSATISVDVGGTPGVANVNGKVWHDKNYDNIYDAGEVVLSNWYVDIYRNTTLLGTVTTDTDGNYSINGLIPNYIGTDRYDIRFRSPGSNSTTAKLGMAYSDPALTYINALHRIYDIVLNPGANVQNLNLPIDPNGVVYNSVTRAAIPGATISLLNAGTGLELSSGCFDDVNQQSQVTTANGYYKFDLNFSQGDCGAGGSYLIRITPPATDYNLLPSTVITPQTDATTAAFNVPNCPGTADDDVAAPVDFCEVQPSELAPTLAVAPASAGTSYYLHLILDNVDIPGDSQIFNNHLPIDPILTNAVAITKTSAFVNVTRGKLVPYTITFTNSLPVDLNNSNIVDNFPAGFKYIEGSARYNNGSTEVALEPTRSGLELTWSNINLPVGQTQTIKLLLIVGAAVNEGPYINKAYVFDTLTNTRASGIANATVRVTADPDFDCSDVIGKVFDDENLDGYQDKNEKGLAGVKLVTVRGITSTSDKHGRFHVTCAVVPNEDRGTNFILKLDERSLPTGYRMTTENPRVQRATRGKMLKFNFGSALHRVVSMDIADGVFVPGSTQMNSQWKPRLDLLIKQLKDKPSILRLSYLADVDDEDLVEDRLEKVKQDLINKWLEDEKYKLTIETEIFWRRGSPPDKGGID